MQNEKIKELENELVQVNILLKNTAKDQSTFEIVDIISRRSFIIRKIDELKWASKHKQERIEQRKKSLESLEKYYLKYGEAENDVSRKFIYKSIYFQVIISLNELNLSIDEKFEGLKIISTAIYEILDSAEFVDVHDTSVIVSLNALIKCLSINEDKISDDLRIRIDKVQVALTKLINN